MFQKQQLVIQDICLPAFYYSSHKKLVPIDRDIHLPLLGYTLFFHVPADVYLTRFIYHLHRIGQWLFLADDDLALLILIHRIQVDIRPCYKDISGERLQSFHDLFAVWCIPEAHAVHVFVIVRIGFADRVFHLLIDRRRIEKGEKRYRNTDQQKPC